MAEPQLDVIYDSGLLRVQDYRAENGPRPSEEVAPDYEIVFQRAGAYLRYDSFGRVLADVNQMVFFQRDQSYEISHPVAGGEHSLLFRLNHPVLLDVITSFNPAVADNPNRPFPIGHALIEPRQRMLQYQLLQAAVTSPESDSLQADERLLLLLGDMLRSALSAHIRHAPPARTNTQRAHIELVQAAQWVLNSRFRERLKLSEVAQAVYTSPYHLCRVFRQVTGVSLHSYLQRLRLFSAIDYLAGQPHDDLTDLALNLGFASHSHFTTAFRQEFDVTPSQFRQTLSTRQLSNILKA